MRRIPLRFADSRASAFPDHDGGVRGRLGHRHRQRPAGIRGVREACDPDVHGPSAWDDAAQRPEAERARNRVRVSPTPGHPPSRPERAASTPRRSRFPKAGAWTIRIDSGFNANEMTLLPLTVIDAGSPSPVPLSPAARGEHLFVAKGCIGCHRHQQVAARDPGLRRTRSHGQTISAGPSEGVPGRPEHRRSNDPPSWSTGRCRI